MVLKILTVFILSISVGLAQDIGNNKSIKGELTIFKNGVYNQPKGTNEGFFYLKRNIKYGEEIILNSERGFTLFLNNKIVGLFNTYTIDGDSVNAPFKNNIFVAIVRTDDFSSFDAHLKLINSTNKEITNLKRVKTNNAIIIMALVILALFGIAKVLFSGYKGDYFVLRRIFSYRDKEEVILWSRHFSGNNLFYMVMLSFVIGFIVVVLFYNNDNVSEFVKNWILIVFGVFIFVNMRISIIKFFGRVFLMKDNAQFHSINFVRLTIVLSLILSFGIFLMLIYGKDFDFIKLVFLKIGLILLLLRFALLSSKLINGSNKQIILKFSYLCGTELIPLLGIIHVASQFS